MKPLMKNARDKNTINTDNYQFYINKLLTSRGNKIQKDVLTKETVEANGLRLVSAISGIIGTCFMMYYYISPDTAVKTAALVAGGTGNVLYRTITLFRHGYGEVEGQDKEVSELPDSEDRGTCLGNQWRSSFADELKREDNLIQGWTPMADEYTNAKTGILNKRVRDDLTNLNKNNQKFRDKI